MPDQPLRHHTTPVSRYAVMAAAQHLALSYAAPIDWESSCAEPSFNIDSILLDAQRRQARLGFSRAAFVDREGSRADSGFQNRADLDRRPAASATTPCSAASAHARGRLRPCSPLSAAVHAAAIP